MKEKNGLVRVKAYKRDHQRLTIRAKKKRVGTLNDIEKEHYKWI